MFLPLSPPVTTKPESGSAENFFKCDPLSLLSPSSKRVLSPIQPSSLDDQHISNHNNSQPSRILPFLFLGGSKDAKNSGYLRTQNVQYIVNCGHETLNHSERREQTLCHDSTTLSSENHRCYHHLENSGTPKPVLHQNEHNLTSYTASWSKSGTTYHKCQNFTHENEHSSEESDENAVLTSSPHDPPDCGLSVFARQISLPVARKEFKNRTIDGNVLNIAAFDSPQQDLKQYFVQVIKFIEKARASNSSILVHCSAGISRSATLVVAYVMWYFQLSFMAAYKFVQNLRPQISPNLNFVGQLVEFATDLSRDDSDILTQLGFSNCKTHNSASNVTREISSLSVPKRKRSVSENASNSKEAKTKKQVKNAINSYQG